MHVWVMLPKAPRKEELQGRAAPRQPAQLPGDSGTAAAKVGQSPLGMSRTTSGGCPGELASVRLCTNTTHPHHQGEDFKNPNPFVYRVLKRDKKNAMQQRYRQHGTGKGRQQEEMAALPSAVLPQLQTQPPPPPPRPPQHRWLCQQVGHVTFDHLGTKSI